MCPVQNVTYVSGCSLQILPFGIFAQELLRISVEELLLLGLAVDLASLKLLVSAKLRPFRGWPDSSKA